MRALSAFCFIHAAATFVAAQLPLPNPPFLPANSSVGAEPTSGGYPNPGWTGLLGSLIYFYDEQRSGVLPSTNRVPWRNDSLILEGLDVGTDLIGSYCFQLDAIVLLDTYSDRISRKGGFYDAGGQYWISC